MTDYITLEAFKNRIGNTTVTNDGRILEHIAAASRKVDAITHRQFGPHDGAASARYFRPLSCDLVVIDDAYEITQVAVDNADAGTYATVWSASDYETDPPNGIGPNGQPDWPATAIRAVGAYSFPMAWVRRMSVKVTAKWGWAAIPDDVIEATYLLAHRLYYEVSVPGGVTAPNPEFGVPGAPLVRPYTAEGLLKPYTRGDRAVGVAG